MVDLALLQARAERLLAEIPRQVTVIAATKYATPEMMRAVYAGGIRHFGENQVQSAQSKRQALATLTDVTWHMIGHLQTNKTRPAIQLFDWIHSIDRLSLAQRLDKQIEQTESDRASPQLCLQVKLAPDPTKSGWNVAELGADLPALIDLPHLRLRGVMTILPLGTGGEPARQLFMATAELAHNLRATLPDLTELSMGMSSDYPEAIAAGATMVRIGSSLFL